MDKSVKKLAQGKVFAIGGFVAVLLIVIGSELKDPLIGPVTNAAGLLILFTLISAQLFAWKKHQSNTRSALTRLTQKQIEINNQAALGELVDEFTEVSGKLRSIAEQADRNRKLTESSHPGLHFDRSTKTPKFSAFMPQLIEATNQIQQQDQALSGRIAANFEADPTTDAKLILATQQWSEKSTRLVTGIVSQELRKAIEQHATYQALQARNSNQVDENTSYLVLEEPSLAYGPWSFVNDTTRTQQFFSLLESINAYKKNGTVIAVVHSSVPTHYSSTLREIADISLSDDGSNVMPENAATLPLCQSITKHLRET